VMPQARFWRTVTATKSADGKSWRAAMPIMDPATLIRAYCDVYYRSGVVLSSVLSKAVPSSLGQATATLKPQSLIEDFAGGKIVDWVWFPSGADPTNQAEVAPHLVPVVDGPDGGWGIGANNTFIKGRLSASTTKICDPAYLPGSHTRLAFRVHGEVGTKLTVVLYRDYWNFKQKEYKAELTIPAGEDWPRLSVAQSDFKDKDGNVLTSWDNLQQLRLEANYPEDKPAAFAMVEWAD